MTDYISRKAVMELVESGQLISNGNYRAVKRLIEFIPAADVVEVVHGEWIDGLDIPKEEREKHPYVYLHGEKHCSVCYQEAYFDSDYGQQLFDYCPNCGAKMTDGGDHDA